MWGFFTAIADEFAKGGLIVLLLTLMLSASVGIGVYFALENRKERLARDKTEDTVKAHYDAKFDALRDRYQDRYDGLLEKYNAALLASTRQTEGYIEAGRNMKELIVELKTTIGQMKEQLLILAASKGITP